MALIPPGGHYTAFCAGWESGLLTAARRKKGTVVCWAGFCGTSRFLPLPTSLFSATIETPRPERPPRIIFWHWLSVLETTGGWMTPIWTLRQIALRRQQRRRTTRPYRRRRPGPGRRHRFADRLSPEPGAVSGVVGGAAALYSSIARQLPDPEKIEFVEQEFETTRIYDRTGQVLLWEIIDPHAGDRVWVPLDEVPEHLICATDRHRGPDILGEPGDQPRGILRAFWSQPAGPANPGRLLYHPATHQKRPHPASRSGSSAGGRRGGTTPGR